MTQQDRPEPTPSPDPAAPIEPATAGAVQSQPIKATERPHPLTPLIRGWVVLLAIIVAVGREFLPGNGRNLEWAERLPIFVIVAIVLGIAALSALIALAGWWFTRFVIDSDELRIETGWLNRSSKRIPFNRIQSVDVIQPLGARIFGLGELRIEAGGGDSKLALRYLKRDKAYHLRDYLLARAHGHRTTLEETGRQQPTSFLEDLSAADQVLVRLQPPMLILGLVTSTEFVVSVLVLIAVMVVTWYAGAGAFALTGLIPLAAGVISMISRRVIAQFNYTLARTSSGALRITRGLTNLTSQSVPVDRIQGVRIQQSWLWRHLLRLHRVDIDVLGYGRSNGNENNRSASSMLLPVASTQQTRIAMANLLPGGEDELVPLLPVPRRAAWLRPIGWRFLRYGWNDRVVVAESGWLQHRREVVPHAKTQSVRLTQGPLQRLLRLASVHLDTTPGPVTLVLHHLDAAVAREIINQELTRAADARALERRAGRPPQAS